MFQLRRCNFSGFCEVKGSGRGREGERGGGETLQWDCSQSVHGYSGREGHSALKADKKID